MFNKFCKNAGSHHSKRRRIMRTFKIDEISAVDRPAQADAMAIIMKRDGNLQTDDLKKRAALTTSDEGHSHILQLDYGSGELTNGFTRYDAMTDEHYHPWIMGEDGNIEIGEADGHTHRIASTSKAGKSGSKHEDVVNKETDTMPDDVNKDDRIKDLEAKLAKSEAISALSDVERTHYNSLSGDAQDTFLAKSADGRKVELEAIAKRKTEEDPVEYTTDAGVELRKSVGPAVIAMAKSNDALAKQVQDLTTRNDDLRIAKRAEEEFQYLPGDVTTRVALIKSVEGIKDEAQRKAAFDALKAQNDAMSKAFQEHGSSGRGGIVEAGSPDAELDTLAKAYATEYKVNEAIAYDEVLKTDKGKELYAKSLPN